MDENKQVALRKRQQITSTNKVMFIWVAVAAGITAIAVVVSISLAQRMLYNEKVLAKKSETVANLEHNNNSVEELKNSVRVRNTDESLRALRADPEDEPLQVVLDALPSSANSAALGASLQSSKLLSTRGIVLESLTVNPVGGVEGDEDSDVDSTESVSANPITFQFRVNTAASNTNGLKALLGRLERSIRVINITDISIERQSNGLSMTASGEGYYEPSRTIDLKKVKVDL
ncbi:hypothetical protein H6796_01230 [Candidatus Nomurabacteria bacterium]|nr:hypothetical protein [Candidatus Nomurabacteria bacterium]